MVQSIVDYANRTNTETCIEGIENQEVDVYKRQRQGGTQAHQYRFYRVIGFRHGIRRFGGAWKREGIVSHFITAL